MSHWSHPSLRLCSTQWPFVLLHSPTHIYGFCIYLLSLSSHLSQFIYTNLWLCTFMFYFFGFPIPHVLSICFTLFEQYGFFKFIGFWALCSYLATYILRLLNSTDLVLNLDHTMQLNHCNSNTFLFYFILFFLFCEDVMIDAWVRLNWIWWSCVQLTLDSRGINFILILSYKFNVGFRVNKVSHPNYRDNSNG